MTHDSEPLNGRELVEQYSLLNVLVNFGGGTCKAMLSAAAEDLDSIGGAELSKLFWKAHLDAGHLESLFAGGDQSIAIHRFIERMGESRAEVSLEPVSFLNSFASSYANAGFEFARRVLRIADDSLAPVLEAIDKSDILSVPIPPPGSFQDYVGPPYIVPLAEHFAEHPSLAALVRKQLADAGSAVRIEFGLHDARETERAIERLYAGIELELRRAGKSLVQPPEDSPVRENSNREP